MAKEVELNAPKNSFIGAWMMDDVSVCDRLIYHFENVGTPHKGEVIEGDHPEIRPNIKDSLDMQLHWDDQIAKDYIGELGKCLNEYKLKYPACDQVMPYRIEDVNLQRYNPGGAYFVWHTERVSGTWDSGRHLVFMTYLNDITDAGGTEFLHQEVSVTPKKGLTLIWPADWTHTHRGIPSLTQTKYIATGWYRFSENQ
tara:strand:+ start:1377 stop:1970 length:594 start_codon:yes stop_codon:yes gene_type:complete